MPPAGQLEDAKTRVAETVDRLADQLEQISHQIHANPELIRIAPDGVPGHSREFAEWARSPIARAGMVAAAKALAMTALDLLAQPDELQKAKGEFARSG